jgi:hypothetical protein
MIPAMDEGDISLRHLRVLTSGDTRSESGPQSFDFNHSCSFARSPRAAGLLAVPGTGSKLLRIDRSFADDLAPTGSSDPPPAPQLDPVDSRLRKQNAAHWKPADCSTSNSLSPPIAVSKIHCCTLTIHCKLPIHWELADCGVPFAPLSAISLQLPQGWRVSHAHSLACARACPQVTGSIRPAPSVVLMNPPFRSRPMWRRFASTREDRAPLILGAILDPVPCCAPWPCRRQTARYAVIDADAPPRARYRGRSRRRLRHRRPLGRQSQSSTGRPSVSGNRDLNPFKRQRPVCLRRCRSVSSSSPAPAFPPTSLTRQRHSAFRCWLHQPARTEAEGGAAQGAVLLFRRCFHIAAADS